MNTNEKIKISLNKLGLKIKKLREEKNISIKELALKTGIRKEYLIKIENGTAYGIIIERHMIKIAQALNIKIYELLYCD